MLMLALLLCHVERIKPADKQHIRIVYSRIVQGTCLEISNDKRGKTVVIVIIDDGKMMLHAVPVVRVKTRAAQIETVSGLLHFFGTGRLSGHSAHIFTEEHSVNTEDPVADGVPDTFSLDHCIHYLVIIILRLF